MFVVLNMKNIKLKIEKSRPFFAEIPYYLWGMVNYDSEGDCKYPTDRMWTWFELTHRDTDESLDISSEGVLWTIKGDDINLSRLVQFFVVRCGATVEGFNFKENLGEWNHKSGMDRADRVAKEFSSPELKPFDTHLFWGSWKWIGWFATEFTRVGRWIMVSVLKNDPRGVPLCID